MKRPSFQFYPGDYLRDAGLRSCSVGARGLWMDMLCHMHEGNPYGHLKVGGKVILPPILARMVGASEAEVIEWLSELDDAGVYSKLTDGCVYSRRMIRDEEIRQERAAGGKLGGNPNLKPKVGDKVNHKVVAEDNQKTTPSSASSSSSAVGTPKPPSSGSDQSAAKAEREALRIRLGGFFNRRPETQWAPKELTALSKIDAKPQDVDLLEWFYKMPLPDLKPFQDKQPVHLRRHDLYTLLNNWPGEIDKAMRQHALAGRPSANENANDIESYDQAK